MHTVAQALVASCLAVIGGCPAAHGLAASGLSNLSRLAAAAASSRDIYVLVFKRPCIFKNALLARRGGGSHKSEIELFSSSVPITVLLHRTMSTPKEKIPALRSMTHI